jgi:hypothetical protein
LLLQRLHQVERLSENFMRNLLSWVHPGFLVFAGPPVEAAALTSLESQACYITRPALAMDALQKLENGRLALHTPLDPRTGAIVLALDPLEWIITFITDPRVIDCTLRHLERQTQNLGQEANCRACCLSKADCRPAICFLPRVPSLPL